MSGTTITLDEVAVEAPRPQTTGRRDHDTAYENDPPAPVKPTQPGASSDAPRADTPDDVVTLIVGGAKFTGWEEVRIIRGMELFPSHFSLRVTERLPDR